MTLKLIPLLLVFAVAAAGYPLDAFKRTGIRRLEAYRLAVDGKVRNVRPVPKGGQFREADVRLRLLGREVLLNQKDPALQRGLERIFAQRDSSYGVALLDITDPGKPRYAAVRESFRQLPGSVGKILVASAVLDATARVYPQIADRERFLRETVRPADEFILTDGKTAPFWEPGAAVVTNRALREGDRFSLWEWLDHMMSQSSNAAGSLLWKEALLLRVFGPKYPPSSASERAFLSDTPRAELGRLSLETMESASASAGLDSAQLRQGTLFTRRGSARIPGTASYATPTELLKWLVRMEQGRLTDEWSSLELKKLLYFSRARYRYAASPALNHAAVYFKSGSFYQCKPEEGFQCRQYSGNVTNIMNSVAVVESAGRVYLVALMSNVLKINSAGEHMAIAGEIERLIAATNDPVQARDEFLQNFAPARMLDEADGDIAAAIVLDDAGVGVPVLPGAGLACDLDVRDVREAFYELVPDLGVGEDVAHFGAEPGIDELALGHEEEEPGGLEGGGAVADIVQRIAPPVVVGTAVSLAEPESAGALEVVEAVFGAGKNPCDVLEADHLDHLRGIGVGRPAGDTEEHLAHFGGIVEGAFADAFEAGHDGDDFGQAGGVHHDVIVDAGVTGVVRISDVDERDCELAGVDECR